MTAQRSRTLARTLLQIGVIGTVFAIGGAVAGWIWERLATPVVGIAFKGRFAVVGEDTGREFAATGSFVVVGVCAGLLLGLAVAVMLRGPELTTLAAAVVAAAGSAWLMAMVGHRVGPPDPYAAAKNVADWTKVPADLHVTGLSPFAALPFGAVLGVVLGFVALSVIGWRVPAPQREVTR